uniref:Uncharacterized protein n=1 Tax=Arundo donax TaxID=35708 RepID=A0A0A9CN83_ARUDO
MLLVLMSLDDRWRASSMKILDSFCCILSNLKPLDPTNVLVASMKMLFEGSIVHELVHQNVSPILMAVA